MPPITYTPKSTDTPNGALSNSNNTVTIRTTVPGKATSAPATGFPLKLEQVQNVNTKNGIPNNSVLRFNRTNGMWEPFEMTGGGNPVVTKRFDFTNSLEWLVQHDMNTTSFRETLVQSDGSKFSAKTKILDSNSFLITLTSAESGWVDVIFNM